MHFPRMSVFAAVCSTHYTHAPPGGRQASRQAPLQLHMHTQIYAKKIFADGRSGRRKRILLMLTLNMMLVHV